MEGEGDSNDVIVISDGESSEAVVINDTPKSNNDLKESTSAVRANVMNTVKSATSASYTIVPMSNPEAMRWLPHRRPSVLMTRRLQYAFGFILVDVMATAAATPAECIMQTRQAQRMLQKYINNRLKAILLGSIVGRPATIMESYRDIFPEATDRELVDRVVNKIQAKRQIRCKVKRRKMRSIATFATQSTSTDSAAQASTSRASISRVQHYRPDIDDIGECSSKKEEQDLQREKSKRGRKYPHTATSSEAQDILEAPKSVPRALKHAPEASNNAPDAADTAQEAADTAQEAADTAQEVTDVAQEATDDVQNENETSVQVLIKIMETFADTQDVAYNFRDVPDNEQESS